MADSDKNAKPQITPGTAGKTAYSTFPVVSTNGPRDQRSFHGKPEDWKRVAPKRTFGGKQASALGAMLHSSALRLAVAAFLLTPAPHAWAGQIDPGAAAIILADLVVTWKAITGPAAKPEPDALAVSAGAFDVGQRLDKTAVYGAEYRFGGRRVWNAQPIIGVGATPHNAVYGYGGLRFSVSLAKEWEVASDFAFAAYHRGEGKDLGSAKEFYFSLGLGYRLANGTRVELAARHMSHDHLFSRFDPGVDIVAVGLAIPLK